MRNGVCSSSITQGPAIRKKFPVSVFFRCSNDGYMGESGWLREVVEWDG